MTTTTQIQKAIQLVIMDAISKGHTNPSELTAYMASKTFDAAVKNYIKLFNEQF